MASDICNFSDGGSAVFLNKLYGQFDLSKFSARISSLRGKMLSVFGVPARSWFSSPGRIEICGNHTDHNNGKVLCASISLDTLAAVTPTEDGLIRICSDGYPVITVSVNDLFQKPAELSTSTALVRGVAAYFRQNGLKTGGFCACADSNVFKGAGISSSASFELLIAEILNVLYNNGTVNEVIKAKAAHYAETVFFGKPCGLLDQCAISFGGICFIDFMDGEPHPKRIDAVPPISVILANAGGDHCSLTAQYAAIPNEMHKVAAILGGATLRDVTESTFYSKLPYLRKNVSGRAILRAAHFYSENRRVDACVNALEGGDLNSFLAGVNDSGNSSMSMLQNCYPNGDDVQLIPSAVLLLRSLSGVRAARVHGGGFAGTVLAFADTNAVTDLLPVLEDSFGKENFHVVSFRAVGACKIPDDCIGGLL